GSQPVCSLVCSDKQDVQGSGGPRLAALHGDGSRDTAGLQQTPGSHFRRTEQGRGGEQPVNRRASRLGTGAIVGIVAIASSYAVAGATPGFVVAPINGVVVILTPSQVIAFAILVLGDLGSKFGFALAVILAVGLFGGLGLLSEGVAERSLRGADATLAAVVLTGMVTGGVGSFLTGSFASGAAIAAGAAVAMAVSRGAVRADRGTPRGERRRFVAAVLGTLGFGGFALWAGGDEGVSRAGPTRDEVLGNSTAGQPVAPIETIQSRLAEAAERSLEVPGMPGLVSENANFYEVDINSIDPEVAVRSWSLRVTGAVRQRIEMDYADLTDMTPEHRFVTLRCVGDPLNGPKMDNALWTGIPVNTLLDRARPIGEYVMLRAVDGYFEEFPLAALRGGFLAYGMNGDLLPHGHGYPVRALVPGHWGEVNVKWIDEIEVLSEPAKGFWEQRGWHGTGPVNTIAKLWAVNRLDDGRVQVGGHAYAGTRGISAVEVSTDGGASWSKATLSPPLEGDDVWRQWSYEWDPSQQTPTLVVRAIDGTGTIQPRAEAQPFPSGATGWVRQSIDVENP
ncbi:MAG: molybdopterin-dependent oxidoreductase, partial [Halodesulfurarchaeum sp.]